MMYLLFSCDEWKSYSSMSLIGLFDEEHLRNVIREEISQNNFELDIELDSASIKELEDCLEYGYIQEVELNERL